MRTSVVPACVLAMVVSLEGCSDYVSGPSSVSVRGGTTATGGSSKTSNNTAGMQSTGGTASGATTTTSSSGSQTKGGSSTSTGGADLGGGGQALGGVSGAGGSQAAGGLTATGGTPGAAGTTSSGGNARTSATLIAAGAPASGGAGATATGGSGTVTLPAKFVGNITTNGQVDTGGLVYSNYWNQITPENAGKWGSVQSTGSSAFKWSTLDAIYDYTQREGIIFKQHTFVWGSQQPGGTLTQANVQAWIAEFCKRYPNTKLIDVVNEPPPHTTPSYADSIGGGTNGTWQWITNSFKWARAACPGAVLILNDYNNIEYAGDATRFIDIVKVIKAAGAPIDAVGAQAHGLDNAALTPSTVKSMIANLNSQTGLPVYITEFDVSSTDDAAQLNIYQQYIPFFLSTDYIKGVTIWGWIYGSTWSLSPNSGLVRNGVSRPAMTWLMQQVGRTAP